VAAPINSLSTWARLVFGLLAIFALFQSSALALGSDRGQAGLSVAALVTAMTLAAERLLFGRTLIPAASALGIRWPRAPGLLMAAAIGALLLLVVPVFAAVTGASMTMVPGWWRSLPGLFAQAGIAEEILFRGYLYGHLRDGRSFWRAAGLATLPFAAAHVILFFTMPWPVALAALILSVVISLPLARLFDVGGGTVWASAIVHFVVQGTIKIVEVQGPSAASFPLIWMAASAVIPMLVFAAAAGARIANPSPIAAD
jgi:membrane protease YdiL (CAAX protease family)